MNSFLANSHSRLAPGRIGPAGVPPTVEGGLR
jgi:hypothetical protein